MHVYYMSCALPKYHKCECNMLIHCKPNLREGIDKVAFEPLIL